MEIKPGAYYKTRDGKKAYVVGQLPGDNCFVISVMSELYLVLPDGSANSMIKQSLRDLVAEWREPVSNEFWLVLGRGANDNGFICYCGTGNTSKLVGEVQRWRIRATEGKGIEVLE